ncbi:MAG: DsbA family protein [Pseudomonadota bacterium]|nr:DsbA family protein [Pseudomonadota bacterium]
MTQHLEFYFDLACPWSWLAIARIDTLAERGSIEIDYRPVLQRRLDAQHYPSEKPASPPAREAVLQADLERRATMLDLPLRLTAAPPDTRRALALIHGAPRAQRPRLVRALAQALWASGEDLNDDEVLRRTAECVGVNPGAADDADMLAAVDAASDLAAEAGVFGTPSIRVGERIWWGADRMDLVRAALGQPETPWPAPAAVGGEIEFFHDFASPFSYLAAMQLEALAARYEAKVVYRPMLLGALFKQIGTPIVPIEQMSAPRRQYMGRDLTDWAELRQVPFRFASHFPLHTLQALRAALVAPGLTLPLYRAAWAEDRDLGEAATLEAVIAAAGEDAAAVLAQAGSDPVKAQLRENTERAVALGACGAPTFLVNGQTLIWGQDRLGHVAAALTGELPTLDRAAPDPA